MVSVEPDYENWEDTPAQPTENGMRMKKPKRQKTCVFLHSPEKLEEQRELSVIAGEEEQLTAEIDYEDLVREL